MNGFLDQILGDLDRRTFFSRYYQKVPYWSVGTITNTAGVRLLDLADVIDIALASSDDEILIAHEDRLHAAELPQSATEYRALLREGWTIGVRRAERRHDALADLSERLEQEFRAPTNLHVYATPANARGFGWHYDVEDVFVLMQQGAKSFSLRKNTLHPWPVLETMPRDLGYPAENSPILECDLAAGDWLYLPAGYWHSARTSAAVKRNVDEKERRAISSPQGDDGLESSVAVSIAAGAMAPTGVSALERVRRRLATSVFWRFRLPILDGTDDEDAAVARCRDHLEALAQDVKDTLTSDDFLRELVQVRHVDSTSANNKVDDAEGAHVTDPVSSSTNEEAEQC